MANIKDITVVELDDGNTYRLKGRACELSSFSYIPSSRIETKEHCYFNINKKERYSDRIYNRIFHNHYGFNEKLHRDDREHAKSLGLTVVEEEVTKVVPTLSSSVYGHRLSTQLEVRDMNNVRVAMVQDEFYRRNAKQIPVIM